MNYKRRADQFNKGVMVGYTMLLSLIFRYVFAILFKGFYIVSVFGVRVQSELISLAWLMCISLAVTLLYVFVLDGERTLTEGVWLALVVPAGSAAVYIAGIIGYIYKWMPLMVCLWYTVSFAVSVFKRVLYARANGKRLKKLKTFRFSFWEAFGSFREEVLPIMVLFSILTGVFNPVVRKNFTSLADVSTAIPKQTEMESLIEEHAEELKVLEETVYSSLDRKQRINALQVLVNIHLAYLGCSDEVRLVSTKDLPEYTGGCYDSVNRCIFVNDSLLMEDDPTYFVSRVIPHECRHAFQDECIRKIDEYDKTGNDPMYRIIREFEYNQSNYIDYDPEEYGSYTEYVQQPLETDANCYMQGWEDYMISRIVQGRKKPL
ncbi:MAG: hypothetical protein IKO61_04665 [Lachnospiraceae bacterium]|nr:hypothetical protein [Lachnospiraceae bacterium]